MYWIKPAYASAFFIFRSLFDDNTCVQLCKEAAEAEHKCFFSRSVQV